MNYRETTVLAKIPKTLYDGRVRKIILFSIPFLFFALLFITLTVNSFAQESEPILVGEGITATQNPPKLYLNSTSVTFTFTSNNRFKTKQDYTFNNVLPGQVAKYIPIQTDNPSILRIPLNLDNISKTNLPGTWNYKLWLGGNDEAFNESRVIASGQYYIYNCTNTNSSGCPALGLYHYTFSANDPVDVYILTAQPDHRYAVWFEDEDKKIFKLAAKDISDTFTNNDKTYPAAKVQINAGPPSDSKTLCLSENVPTFFGIKTTRGLNCDFSLPTKIKVVPGPVPSTSPTPIQSNEPGIPTGIPEVPGTPTTAPPLPPCAEWANLSGTPFPKGSNDKQIIPADPTPKKCIAVDTAIGNISTDPFAFVKSIMSVLLSLAGGIAVILIIVSGYRLMISQGNPEAIKAAQEQLTSAIVGFLFIIFSLVILQVIGVDILHIPGFTK